MSRKISTVRSVVSSQVPGESVLGGEALPTRSSWCRTFRSSGEVNHERFRESLLEEPAAPVSSEPRRTKDQDPDIVSTHRRPFHHSLWPTTRIHLFAFDLFRCVDFLEYYCTHIFVEVSPSSGLDLWAALSWQEGDSHKSVGTHPLFLQIKNYLGAKLMPIDCPKAALFVCVFSFWQSFCPVDKNKIERPSLPELKSSSSCVHNHRFLMTLLFFLSSDHLSLKQVSTAWLFPGRDGILLCLYLFSMWNHGYWIKHASSDQVSDYQNSTGDWSYWFGDQIGRFCWRATPREWYVPVCARSLIGNWNNQKIPSRFSWVGLFCIICMVFPSAPSLESAGQHITLQWSRI